LFCILDCDCSWDAEAADDVLLQKLLEVAELMLVTGFALIHLLKYSTAMMAKV
jgi:hypothetical protein